MSTGTPIRLQKFLADSGLCSRRSAEAMIAEGEVWVNGKAATPGLKVTPGVDRVTVRGKQVRSSAQQLITLVVNKPRGLICSNDDPHNPETVFSLVPPSLSHLRFFCAGRLDKDSEGLVILTTDGDLANRLMHPSHRVVKRYHVTLEKPYPGDRLNRLIKGIVIEGERLKVERAALVNPGPSGDSRDLDVHMNHGRKREIRQLFTALRHEVRRLRRYQVGAVRLKGIPLRGCAALSTKGIARLFLAPPTPSAEIQAVAHERSEIHED